MLINITQSFFKSFSNKLTESFIKTPTPLQIKITTVVFASIALFTIGYSLFKKYKFNAELKKQEQLTGAIDRANEWVKDKQTKRNDKRREESIQQLKNWALQFNKK